jgi:hypothetical protein
MTSEPRVVVRFYESQQSNPAVPWDVFTIPAETQATVKDGRAVLSALYPAPRRIPPRGSITVTYQGALAQQIEYSAGIPSIRAARAIDFKLADEVHQALASPSVFDDAEDDGGAVNRRDTTLPPIAQTTRTAPHRKWTDPSRLAISIGPYHEETAVPSTPDEIEAMFPSYGAHPDEKWIQMNPRSDPYVIQIKLKKLLPDDAHRDADGSYWVYGVERLAVHISAATQAPPMPNKLVVLGVVDPKTDREKILVI